MSDRTTNSLRLHVEASSDDVAALASYQPFAAARVVSRVGVSPDDNLVALIPGAHEAGVEVTADRSESILLPGSLDPALAILVPPLAQALALWESLRLELGDAAVWTTGAPLSGLVGQIALWRGACPGIALGAADDALQMAQGGLAIDSGDQQSAAAALAEITAARPGFAAVDLSGRAEIVDVLLEAIPRFGRLLLAGPAGQPATIDFYKNVHRKGIVLATTTIEPTVTFEPEIGTEIRAQVGRASRILSTPAMCERCVQLLGARQAQVPVSIAS